MNARSTVGLREASTAAEMNLQESEIVCRHNAMRLVHLQRSHDLVAARVWVVERHRRRFVLGEVSEQRERGVRHSVTICERHVDAIHLHNTVASNIIIISDKQNEYSSTSVH